MDFTISVNIDEDRRRLGWIAIQPDDSVSVGLNDRAFISPDFKAKIFLWNAYNRVSTKFLVPSIETKLKGIQNPHLTYHPPIMFHLGVTKGKKLFQGIADLQIQLEQDGSFEWIRFVSRPVSKLKQASNVRRPWQTESIEIPLNTTDCSVGLGVDFAKKGVVLPSKGLLYNRLIECRSFNLRVFAELLPPQKATLSWYHHH